MKLKYNHDGDVRSLELSTDKPAGKRLAVRHNDQIFYASLVDTDDVNASTFSIVFDGGTYALSTGAVVDDTPDFIVYYSDGTSEELAGVRRVDLSSGYPNASQVSAFKGGTIIAGDTGVVLGGRGGNGLSLVGGAGNDTFVYDGGFVTVDGFDSDSDCVSLANDRMLDVTALNYERGIKMKMRPQGKLLLAGVSDSATVTVNNLACYFDNDSVKSVDGKGVTLTTENVNIAIPSSSALQTVIANCGGTIDASDVTLAPYIGGSNVSLQARSASADYFIFGNGIVTISGSTSSDTVKMHEGLSLRHFARDESNATIAVVDSAGNVAGSLVAEGNTSALTYVSGSSATATQRYGGTMGEDGNLFNTSKLSAASRCTLFGSSFFDAYVETEDGNLVYNSLDAIMCAENDSTIYGNDKANHVYAAGGKKNFFVGGVGADRYHFINGGGGVIADYGVGSGKLGDGTSLPSDRTAEGFNRYDVGSYRQGVDVLCISDDSTIRGIYYDKSEDGNESLKPCFDAVLVYDHPQIKDNVILLKNVNKKPSNTNADMSARRWNTNTFHTKATAFVRYESSVIQSTEKLAMLHDWADFPESLQPAVIALYEMYNASNYINSCDDDSNSTVHSSLPAWIPTRSDSP